MQRWSCAALYDENFQGFPLEGSATAAMPILGVGDGRCFEDATQLIGGDQ